jgi:CRISPR system Cascade subunit CasD
MSTLLLRLAGPLQAWGASSKFDTRLTNRWPTKSGVIGMVAAALGRGREESISDLAALKYGVRIDQEGEILRDYHTAHHPGDRNRSYVTIRYYLTDALFLAGLEGDEELLAEIDAAVRSPVYPLFLGRRSCPPAGQISLGIRSGSLEDSLREETWLAADWYMRRKPEEVRLETVCDAESGESSQFITDTPISFDQDHRKHGYRAVAYGTDIVLRNGKSRYAGNSTDLDAIAELRRGGE